MNVIIEGLINIIKKINDIYNKDNIEKYKRYFLEKFNEYFNIDKCILYLFNYY